MNIKYKNNLPFLLVVQKELKNGIYEKLGGAYLVVYEGMGWYCETLARARSRYQRMAYNGWIGWPLHSYRVRVRKVS